MADGENRQQARDARQGDGQGADVEPHRVHLLPGERELLAECHRYRVYLAICGAVLPVSDLAGSSCPEDCERIVAYCQKCVSDAARLNADYGLDCSTGAGR
ncbi:MAG: hypothetical protein ACRDSR_28085 [Pseudonocardiaceae bacterium]